MSGRRVVRDEMYKGSSRPTCLRVLTQHEARQEAGESGEEMYSPSAGSSHFSLSFFFSIFLLLHIKTTILQLKDRAKEVNARVIIDETRRRVGSSPVELFRIYTILCSLGF